MTTRTRVGAADASTCVDASGHDVTSCRKDVSSVGGWRAGWLGVVGLLLFGAPAHASPSATLVYNNRPITELRADILTRSPAERVAGAVRVLDQLADTVAFGRVGSRIVQGITVVTLNGHAVFAILPADVDELAGETLEGKTADTVARLQVAFDEAVELRTPARVAQGAVLAALMTALFVVLMWALLRGHRLAGDRLQQTTERHLQALSRGDLEIVRASRAPAVARRVITLASVAVALFLTYGWLTFTLRRFPYTRPWGESLRGFLFAHLETFGLGILAAVPGVFTILLIIVITRFFVRLSGLLFDAIEKGRITVPWIYAETAQPTRRIASGLLWLFALAVAYPYLPGSESDAFKGVSVFVGLMISLGSSGIVNQIMSGLTITYSRALRVGDFVKVGDVEGTVTLVGALSTKIKTVRGEEVTLPNAVVVSNTTTNYSRFAEQEGVLTATSVTIGYDTPWRQVRALLLMAAERTPGVRRQPEPIVRQTALRDFYVEYTLLLSPEQPHLRVPILDALHGNILDAFNEYGVQITSPNYEADPDGPKVVPRDKWYSPPASSEAPIDKPELEGAQPR